MLHLDRLAAAVGADSRVLDKARRILDMHPIAPLDAGVQAAALFMAFVLCGVPQPEHELASAAEVPVGALERHLAALSERVNLDVLL